MSKIKSICTVMLFGIISGFTLMISGGTLNFWLTSENIDIRTIGFLSLVSLPYAINFIWAIFFDIIKIPYLSVRFGQRLSWLIVLVFFLTICIYSITFISPQKNILLFSWIAFCMSFFSSAKDTILGALRAELIDEEIYKETTGWYVIGYKIGLVFAGAFAIYISSYLSWQVIFQIAALVVLLLSILLFKIVLYASNYKTPDVQYKIMQAASTHHACSMIYRVKVTVKEIFQDIMIFFGSKKSLLLIMLLLLFYRMPDNFISVMISPFLVHLKYNVREIATSGKFVGTIGTIIGGIITSSTMRNFSLKKMLLYCSVIHCISHVTFIMLIYYKEPRLINLFSTTGIHSVTSGMNMAAYITFITYLCQGKTNFRSMRYSFLSSMMGLSRSLLPSISGIIVNHLGWERFFVFVTLCGVPAICIVLYLHEDTIFKK